MENRILGVGSPQTARGGAVLPCARHCGPAAARPDDSVSQGGGLIGALTSPPLLQLWDACSDLIWD